jgi:hypothetical protein
MTDHTVHKISLKYFGIMSTFVFLDILYCSLCHCMWHIYGTSVMCRTGTYANTYFNALLVRGVSRIDRRRVRVLVVS